RACYPLLAPPPAHSTLFPYTTLFRSHHPAVAEEVACGPARTDAEAIIGGVAHRTARPMTAILGDIDLDGHHRITWRIGQGVDAHRGVAEQFAGVERSLRAVQCIQAVWPPFARCNQRGDERRVHLVVTLHLD